MEKKRKRILALLLAILCFLMSPMSVYASVDTGFGGQNQMEAAAEEEKKEAETGESDEAGKQEPETDTKITEPQEAGGNRETESMSPDDIENLENPGQSSEKETDIREEKPAPESEPGAESEKPYGMTDKGGTIQTETSEKELPGPEQKEETKKQEETEDQTAPEKMARAAGQNSIYLTARQKAVTLDQVTAVTVGNVHTQIPEGYEGYVRTVTSIETNFSTQTFVPDKGALKGKEGCISLTENDKNKYFAWYRNSMFYQGQWLDIKVTLTDFELRNGAMFRFVPNRPGIETYKVDWADVRMEYFRSDTKAAVSVKGYVTFRDIDLFQGIVLKEGFGRVFADAETLPNLRMSVVNSRNYYYDISGLNQTSADKGFMLSALIQGTSAWMTFTFVRPENDLGTSLTPSGGISAESYKIFPSAHPQIEKYVSDSDETMVASNTLSNREETFTYTLMTTVPMETEGTIYQDWSVFDTLDDYLEIRQVSVTNENNADASVYWTIQKKQSFLAQCSNIRNLGFYGHTYYFRITVGIRKEAALKNRWEKEVQKAVIRNQAHASSDGKTVDSKTVTTTVPMSPASVSVEKRDSLTGEVLPGAEFSIYEWKNGAYAREPAAVLKGGENGLCESGDILTYTGENEGKFKLVETKAPDGYRKDVWEKEFVLSGLEKEKITFQGEEACVDEPQWIRIQVKKTDALTGKAVEGAVFAVEQWSEKEQKYVSCFGTENQKEEFVTDQNGTAKSSKLYYQTDNQGKFRVQEKETPEAYFGDYQEEDPKRDRKTYDFQVSAENDGKTLLLSNTKDGNTFLNSPKRAAISVIKIGEVLKGTERQEEIIHFFYEKKPLPGAKFEITAAEDIYQADGVTLELKKGETADELETGSDGKAVSKMLYPGKYIVTEVKAPEGFVIGKTEEEASRRVTLDCSSQQKKEAVFEELVFENDRPRASVTVWKKSENTRAGLSGAVFGLYAGEPVCIDGQIAVPKGALLAKAVSKSDGSCSFRTDIPCGYSYYVKEIQAPENYCRQSREKEYSFTWKYRDDRTDVYSFPATEEKEASVFYNKEVSAEITLKKLDAESGLSKPQQEASLEGAVYGLYALETIWSPEGTKEVLYEKDMEISRQATDSQGMLWFKQVPLGKYYVKEIRASEGYLADDEIYEVDCSYEGEDIPVVKRSLTSRESVKKQKIRCFKLTGDNKETDLEWMEGAGFSVFSISELEKEAGEEKGAYLALSDEELVQKIIDLYRDRDTLDYSAMKKLPTVLLYDEEGKEERSKEFYSDKDGILESPMLPYGHYLLVETTVPEGKTAVTPRVITIDSDAADELVKGDGKGEKLPDFALWDQPKTSYLKITKEDAFTGRKVAKPGAKYVIHDVEGAYFKWYMKDKTSEEKINYINHFGNLVVAYTNGEIAGSYENPYETAVRKDADGKNNGTYVATTEPLPAGLYILEEVEAPQGYIKQGFEGVYRTRKENTFFEAAAFGMPEWEAVHSLSLSLDDVGKWNPSEKASKDRRLKINIGSVEEKCGYDRLAGHFVTEVCQTNDPAVGKLSIYAEGQVLKNFSEKTGFQYEYRGIPGNVFTVRAAENIYSGEGGENQTLLFAKGSEVVRLVTDGEGKAWTGPMEAAGFSWYGLPLGIYTVEQTKAAEGYALTEKNSSPKTFEISYAGQEIPIVYQNALYDIPRQKVKIQVSKQDAEDGGVLAGAVFGLYAGQDILAADGQTVLVKKDTLLAEAATGNAVDQRENAVFDLDLPTAFYYVREEKAPDGYYLSSEVHQIDARFQPDNGEILKFTEVFTNYRTMLQVNFMDYETEVELDDVCFSILDEAGNTVCKESSVHDKNVLIRGLQPGRVYQIQVTKARNGYQWNLYEKKDYLSLHVKDGYETAAGFFRGKQQNPINIKENVAKILLEDEECVQVLSLFQKSVQGNLCVCKKGEIPETKISGGKLKEIRYKLQGLPGAGYEVSAKETIFHPDGYSPEIYHAGEKIAYLVTDEKGNATLSGLYTGRYEVTEIKAPEGFTRSRSDCCKTVEISQEDNSQTDMEAEITFVNPRQLPDIGQDPDQREDQQDPGNIINDELKGRTGIIKTGADGERESETAGAEFTLYAKKDITDVSGSVVIPAGTEIERAVSDAYGRAAFHTDLPMGTYTVKETKAPDGYYLSGTEILFDFESYKRDDEVFIVRMQGSIKNAVTHAKLFLKDDKTGNELAGAVLQISDENGEIHSVIHTENTEGKGHVITGLIPEKIYKITEIMPRNGYVSEIYIPNQMQGILTKSKKQEVTFSIPQIVTDDGFENLPDPTVFELENAFVTGNVSISKTGELLNTVDRKIHAGEKLFNLVKTWFGYVKGGLKQVEFSVFAETDICHPDGVTGILFHAGDLVECRVREKEKMQAVIQTDAAGMAEFQGLYLGQYCLKETGIPEGYRKNEQNLFFTLSDKGEDMDTVYPEEGTIPVYNERQQVDIQVIKCDADQEEKVLSGAVFGLYAGEDICTANGTILLEKDVLIETQETDADGKAQFDRALPNGRYYIAELEAPEGYVSSSEIILVDASWKESGVPVQTYQIRFTNEITKVNVRKKARDTDENMAGAKLAIYEGNTCVESWTTTEQAHCVEGLKTGAAYTLREIAPAPGYVTAEDVAFVVEDARDGVYSPQEIVMEDDVTEVHISVFELDGKRKIPLGKVKAHLETAEGKPVLAENNPSGKDGAWESGAGEEEIWKKLPVGVYQAVVDAVPEGYVVPEKTRIEVKDTREIQTFEIMVLPISVRITGYALASTVSEKTEAKKIINGIFAHITGRFGEKSEELPVLYTHVPAGSCDIVTDKVPEGYVLLSKTSIQVRGDTAEIQDFQVEVRPTVIKIVAVDKKTQSILDGVKVTVMDENGKTVWKNITLTTIKEKVIPMGYTISTEKVPDGYQKPEKKTITVKAVSNLQTYKIELKKKEEETKKKTSLTSAGGNTAQGYGSGNGGTYVTEGRQNTAARTGDTMDAAVWLVINSMAVFAAAVMWKKRKKRC